jgi:hypothetical protein
MASMIIATRCCHCGGVRIEDTRDHTERHFSDFEAVHLAAAVAKAGPSVETALLSVQLLELLAPSWGRKRADA